MILPTPQTLARHGLSESDYIRLWEFQGGRCGVCNRPPAKAGRLVIDHCHRTKQVRGLVHPLCNGKLGKVQDNVTWLDGAAAYLRDPPASRCGITALSRASNGNKRRRRRTSSK
ncbi:MAG TPA: endonuclease VII domain-containing protein [Propionicimonas sp.]|nr:endonuclease VII domain-containing protein [Propionicimonas sp.]